MTSDELIAYVSMVLAQNADGPPVGPRPEGAFIGSVHRAGLTGLRLAAPDGTVLYVAVLEENAFEQGERDSGRKG